MTKKNGTKSNTKKKINTFLKEYKGDKIVGVIWEDAMTYTAVEIEVVKTAGQEKVETYGKIAHFDEDYIVIMTHDSGGGLNDYVKVPMTLIRDFITS